MHNATAGLQSNRLRSINFTAQGLLCALRKAGIPLESSVLVEAARASGVELPPDATPKGEPFFVPHLGNLLVTVESAEYPSAQYGSTLPTTFVYGEPELWHCEGCGHFNVPGFANCIECGKQRHGGTTLTLAGLEQWRQEMRERGDRRTVVDAV